MAVDTSFASLFENLKLEDPWLPPKPWESIPSESGVSHSNASTSQSSLSRHLYDTSTVSEASLVRLAMNALQGVESALISIEKLSAAFCSDPADRTSHRIPSLWHRSSSTHSLGNILKSIGSFGCIVFLLRKFVDYFTVLNVDGNSVRNNHENSKTLENQVDCNKVQKHSSYGLVNQAFSIAVGKVLDGYICGLDTLYASVGFRRSLKTVNTSSSLSSGVGCLTSVVHSEITLLEVYLHTKELRTQIEALGNICNVRDVAVCFSVSSFEDLIAKANLEFLNFPRGGDLLTYLYTQLKVADPVHCALIKFLFLRSCEPYCGFVRSWIYKANISDPYKEFIIEYDANPPFDSTSNAATYTDFPLATITERDGVAIPCFLKDHLIPLLRAGRQLQVLIRLLELCNHVGAGNGSYKDIFPSWSKYSVNHPSYACPVTFNKGSIEAMVLARKSYYKRMQEKLDILLTKLEIRYQQVIQHVSVSMPSDNSGRSPNIPLPLTMDDCLISCSPDEKDDLVSSQVSSTTDEFSYLGDELETSECSSLNSTEEQNEDEQLIQHRDGLFGPEQKYLSTLDFSSSVHIDGSSLKPSQSELSHLMESNSCKNGNRAYQVNHFVHPHQVNRTLGENALPFESGEPNMSKMSETRYIPGGFLKNYFSVSLDPSEHRLKLSDRNPGDLMDGTSHFGNTVLNALTDEATSKDQLPHGTFASSNSFSTHPWKLRSSNFFCMNPILTKNSLIQKPGGRCIADCGEPFSCFDFSSVKDPCEVYSEDLSVCPGYRLGSEPIRFKNSSPDFTCNSVNHDKKGYDGDGILIDKTTSCCIDSPLESKDCNHEHVILEEVSGGGGWESMLGFSNNTVDSIVGDHKKSLGASFEMPLDFVIEKCLLQEILLQYKYVSKLTIKLLEEGFGLQEHLLALRRYHFMELADWADLFITSLWHHKWYITEADRRLPEIQGLLESSVQKSSCERDHNKERLSVYTKEHGIVRLSTSAIGVHSFDFLGLGYRVDWPVNIVLTPNTLKIYAAIFSFLVQVKLAVFSLTEVWSSLKDLLHVINQNRHSELHESEVRHFNVLTKVRHQVNHFVCTLQQYIHSQLSHVAWCKFQHSLLHKVKDMMDLESVHMAYLTNSLHICFLSDETRSIARIIESILQCALDFRSCLFGGTCDAGLDGSSSCKLSRINISQVLAIRTTFSKNLKELHLCYLKSPKHREFGLSRFWGYLNYNEYYSDISNGTSPYIVSV